MTKLWTLLPVAAFLVNAPSGSKIQYPIPPKGGQVDDYHGVKIADPYRELENADSPATQKWIEAENELTFSYLKKLPGRGRIGQQLAALWNYERFTDFSKAGDR
jgi:prolyl oligopeptidase